MGWQKGFYSFVVALLTATPVFADDPKLVNVELGGALSPIGFDDNDRSQVVVAGIFPDACYRVGPYQVSRDDKSKTIYVRQTAYYYKGDCLDVTLPFTQVINLSILKQGNYTIRDRLTGKKLGALPVVHAKNSGPDDYLYAPVSDAYVHSEGGKHYLSLEGTFTNSCMKLKEVWVNYYKDIIVVQPVAEYVGTGCKHELVPFQHEEQLKDTLFGNALLHVRSMEGQAINRIVGFPIH